jgi:hypothetical protein
MPGDATIPLKLLAAHLHLGHIHRTHTQQYQQYDSTTRHSEEGRYPFPKPLNRRIRHLEMSYQTGSTPIPLLHPEALEKILLVDQNLLQDSSFPAK